MRKKGLFYVVAAAFFTSALVPLFVPFAISADGNLNVIGYIAGGLFWAGLLLGSLGYLLMYQNRKEKIAVALPKGKVPSAFRFFSNPSARIADTLLIIGTICTVFCFIYTEVNQYVVVVSFSLLLIGIYGHLLFNGKVFRYMQVAKKNMSKR